MNSILAIADQGITSLGNFLSVLLLARILAPVDYGVFAILFGVMLMLNSVHAAVVTYPLSLEAAVGRTGEISKSVAGGMVVSLLLGIVDLAALSFSCLRLQRWDLVLITAIGLMLWQLQETCRRGLIAQYRFNEVVWGDAVGYIGQFFGLLALWWFNQMSLFNIFSILAVTSFVALVIQAAQTGIAIPSAKIIWNSLGRSMRLGKWAILSHLSATVASVPMYVWILGVLFSSSDAAVIQALNNILGPTNPIILAMAALVVPAAARAASNASQIQAWKCARAYGISFAFLLLPYYLFLVLMPRLAVSLFYGRSTHYLGWVPVLRWLALSYALTYVAQVIGSFLRAIERMQIDFAANLVAAISALAVFLIGAKRYDPLLSAVFSFVLATTLRTAILWWWTIRITKAAKAAETPLVAAV
jgi:O-antigen/teichoic acid export membrane protein